METTQEEKENSTIEKLAIYMFEAYNEQAGGLTWDGKPIPDWVNIGEKVQNNWKASAKIAIELFRDGTSLGI